ncbi:MAG: helix-turn-helix domain containing protein [Candidatus Sphingomonas phytovorans]|nr:TetR/AcrR family transcriptional regulator [Sphingomonas sp.]WEK00983.1 MAG: helix-turn-helix domain containing protein [Sphingomonas sp.]
MTNETAGTNGGIVERGRGRPRDAEKDQAIRDAAWDVLARKGYDGLTFEAVAEAAGCGRATLYRRFSSKLELIAAIMHETSRQVEPEIPPGMDAREGLLAHAGAFARYMEGSRGKAILSLSEAESRLPDLALVTARQKENEREYYYMFFRRLAPNASPEHLSFTFDTLAGAMLHHTIVCRRTMTPRDIEMIVDTTLFLLCREPEDTSPENARDRSPRRSGQSPQRL